MARTFSRRDVLKASSALALTLPAMPLRAAAPPPTAITPDLIAAAQKEGKVVYYTSIDLSLAEKIAKAFEAFGIAVRVGVPAPARVQRIGQVPPPHMQFIGRQHVSTPETRRHLAAYVQRINGGHPPTQRPHGLFASFRVGLGVIGCCNLVKTRAPKVLPMLDPK